MLAFLVLFQVTALNIPLLILTIMRKLRQLGIWPRSQDDFRAYCQLLLTKLLLPKLTSLYLASDGFGQLWDKLHLDEDKANPFQLSSPDPHHFLSVPSSSPPLPLHRPPDRWTPWDSLVPPFLGSTIFVKFFSYPLKLDAALWCTLANEIWVGVKYATSNKKVGNHWDRPPSLCISSSTLAGTYKAVAPLSWSQDEKMWNKGPRKAMVDKWHEQERHPPCYNPLQICGCLLPTVTSNPS